MLIAINSINRANDVSKRIYLGSELRHPTFWPRSSALLQQVD